MIAKMYKARIVVLKDDIDNVLKQIQKSSCLMIIDQETSANRSSSVESMIQRTSQTLKVINKYKDKKEKIDKVGSLSYSELDNMNLSSDINKEVEDLISQRSNILQEIKQLNEETKALSIFKDLPVSIGELNDTVYSRYHLGFVETKKLDALLLELDNYSVTYKALGQSRNLTALYLVSYCEDDLEIVKLLKEAGYNDYSMPSSSLTVPLYLESLDKKIKELNNQKEAIEKDLKDKSLKITELETYVDHLLTKEERNKVDYLETSLVYVIDGWVPEEKVDRLKKFISKATEIYDIELTSPGEDEIVPTYTVNNKIVEPFESITNEFSVPNTKEIDPNPVMSIWYWLLFGMMVGDVGYGILLGIATFLFIKLKKPKGTVLKLSKILCYSSISTILWGIFFNSYFGAQLHVLLGISALEYKPIIDIMGQPMPLLVLSIIVGVLHIITGLVMKVVKDLRNKEIQEMLGKDLSWILILIGLGLFAGSMVTPVLNKWIGISVILVGVALVLLFAGHAKKNILARGMGGVAALYDATSFLGDILSYSRIMALVMSSAAVASVMNTLAGMVKGGFIGTIAAILIFIIGHIFNLALGLLSAYVHDCRLQYIEFYGKFYDGGGKLFKPLAPKTKYTDEIKIKEI